MRNSLIMSAAIFFVHATFAQNVTVRPLVYQVPDMSKVSVKEKVTYKKVNDTALTLDVYYPPGFDRKKNLPVVVFNNGAGGFELPQWRGYRDWARLIAVNGMIAVLHQTRPNRSTAMEDCSDVMDYLHQQGSSLNIDKEKMAIWTSSANSRTGMVLALRPGRNFIRSLVVYYGGPDSIGEMRQDVPTLMVRAGLDAQFLNMGIDNFIQSALQQDVRIELVNYLDGIHAFDIYTNTNEAKSVIKRTVDFLKKNLTEPVPVSGERVLTNRNFMWMMNSGQSKEALTAFRKAVVRYRADSTFHPFYNAVIREDVLNANAYWLLRNGKQAEALEAFRLLVETYPASANAFDSLGDAYETLGKKDEAISSSEKSLELLAKDTNMNAQFKERVKKSAEDKIKRLKGGN
ncbi:MAG TPA: tetratricopeptide repeat protein [Chitinophagaceae bacterium]